MARRPSNATPKRPVIFTSGAYDAATTPEVLATASGWLEEQSKHPFIRATGERTLAALDLRPGERVLDVGCGTGVFLGALATAVGETGAVVGIDHSAALLDAARERLATAGLDTRVTLHEGDAHRLPFENGSFDAAHTERVLMHLEDPDLAIRELVRVVRPGGRVVSAEVYPKGSIIENPDHELMERLSDSVIAGIRNPWMGLELRRRFPNAGLRDVRVQLVVDVEDVLDPEEGSELARLAGVLADAGDVDRERVTRLVETMNDAHERGYHVGYALMFVAAGRVPA